MPTTPTGMTFNSLVEDLSLYTERGGDSDTSYNIEVPRLINRAERSIADKFKLQGYRDVLLGRMEAQNPTIAKPEGWRSTVSINYGVSDDNNKRRVLRLRSYEYLRTIYPNDTTYDAPALYADYDQNHWIVGATPDQNYPFEATIYRLPPLLSASNQQNYLTMYTPNLLLYTCLVGLEPFLKNDSRLQTWQQLLADETNNVTTQDLMKMMDRALRRTTS